MESQIHGILFENDIIKARTGLEKAEYQRLLPGCYTATMDITKGYYSDYNVSIKAAKLSRTISIGCGDIMRFQNHCQNSEFIMVLGVWTQSSPTQKSFVEIYEFEFTPASYDALWGGIRADHLRPFVDYVKAIPPGKTEQMANRKLWKQKRQAIVDSYGGVIKIDAKIDSASQRRVQCSIKLNDLIASGVKCDKYVNSYYTIKLPYDQSSAPRSRS